MKIEYLFTSNRLGFRNWTESDILIMAEINADQKVMEFFPSIQTPEQTEKFVRRMQQQFLDKGFCYFAVDKLSDNGFIGFIGLSEQNFKADFTPCVDIGWRLHQKEWGKGYATEGAKKCLEFAFQTLSLTMIKAICPVINNKSEGVMKKLNMEKKQTFDHPLLKDDKDLEKCVVYEIKRTNNT